MQVPLIDLKAQYLSIKDEIDEAVARVLASGNYVMGDEVRSFEIEWARYCKADYCVAVSSGTDALYLSLRTWRLLQGDDVNLDISVPVRTFMATGVVVPLAGCFLSLRDSEFDPRKDPWQDVIIVVDLYGEPARIPRKTQPVSPGAKPNFILVDAAQSHGIPLRGDVACYSFYPTKNLGAVGQGGAVVTNNKEIYELVKVLRSHGEQGGRFRHAYLSGNYRMDELQAAILRAKLPHLDDWNKRRRSIADFYRHDLRNVPQAKEHGESRWVELPEDHPQHVYHIYAVKAQDRDGLAMDLAEKGVQTAVRYPIPLHLQPCLAHQGYKKGDFPEAEEWADTNLSLPIYPEMTDAQVEYVTSCVKEWTQHPG